jgi:hypothetical protein
MEFRNILILMIKINISRDGEKQALGGPAGVAPLTCWGQNKSSFGDVGDSN